MPRLFAGRPSYSLCCIATFSRLWLRCVLALLAIELAGCARLRQTAADLRGEQEHLTQQARRAQDQGNVSQAEELYTRAVNADPANCDTRLELSELLLEHGSLDAATLHLRRVVEQNPDDPRGHVRLAQALLMQKKDQEAGQLLLTALEIDPSNPQGLLLHGQWLERRGESVAALETYYRAIPLLANPTEAELRIAAIKLREGRESQAAALLRGIIDNSHSCPTMKSEAYWMLGQAYGREGRWRDAAVAMESSLKLKNPSPEEWRMTASAHYRAGEWSEAIRCTELSNGTHRLADSRFVRTSYGSTPPGLGTENDRQDSITASQTLP